jgi:hypothetical protein
MRLSKKSKVSYLLLDVVNAEEFLKVLNVPLTRDFIQILYQLQVVNILKKIILKYFRLSFI